MGWSKEARGQGLVDGSAAARRTKVCPRAPCTFAAGLHAHEVFSSIDVTDPLIRANLSLLLQITCIEYTEIFQKRIDYSSGGDSLTVKEQADQVVDRAFSSTPLELFPRPVVMDNVYYIVGFLGGQAKKHAKRMAEESGNFLV